jgi:hypothetical protein
VQFKSDGHNGETLDGPLVYGSSPSEHAMLDLNIPHSTLEKPLPYRFDAGEHRSAWKAKVCS